MVKMVKVVKMVKCVMVGQVWLKVFFRQLGVLVADKKRFWLLLGDSWEYLEVAEGSYLMM